MTDNASATSTSSRAVPVAAGGITLTARGYKVKGFDTVDLSWTGATGSVDVLRNGVKITTVSGSSYTDGTGSKGAATFTYQVCNAGTSVCSAAVTVVF